MQDICLINVLSLIPASILYMPDYLLSTHCCFHKAERCSNRRLCSSSKTLNLSLPFYIISVDKVGIKHLTSLLFFLSSMRKHAACHTLARLQTLEIEKPSGSTEMWMKRETVTAVLWGSYLSCDFCHWDKAQFPSWFCFQGLPPLFFFFPQQVTFSGHHGLLLMLPFPFQRVFWSSLSKTTTKSQFFRCDKE